MDFYFLILFSFNRGTAHIRFSTFEVAEVTACGRGLNAILPRHVDECVLCMLVGFYPHRSKLYSVQICTQV